MSDYRTWPSQRSEKRKEYYRRTMALRDGELTANSNGSCIHQLAIRSHAEIGRIMGMSRQAVHQIERRAIYKLRQSLIAMMAQENALPSCLDPVTGCWNWTRSRMSNGYGAVQFAGKTTIGNVRSGKRYANVV